MCLLWSGHFSEPVGYFFADIAYLCFHFLDIFRAPVPIHKSGEMRQDYEKQKTKVSY